MICLACKKQIPDDSTECPNCGSSIDHQLQVVHEIKMRRYQRWVFYGFIIILFLGMIGAIGWIYRENTKLVADITGTKNILDAAQKSLEAKESELNGAKGQLSQKDTQYQEISAKAGELEKNQDSQTGALNQIKEEKDKIDTSLKQCYMDSFLATANVYGLITKIGKKLSIVDLNKIPVATDNITGIDTDSDGLSDEMEAALGTKADNADTDGDKYTDKDELSRNFNPRGAGKMPIDISFSNKLKGSMVVQSNSPNLAWFIGDDGKRYFMGSPVDAYKHMRSLDYWVSDWKKISSADSANTSTSATANVVPDPEMTKRDAQRLADIKSVQTALELFFNDNNKYPSSLSSDGFADKFLSLSQIPSAPLPPDGNCTIGQNTYTYTPYGNYTSYNMTYCIGGTQSGIPPGYHTATPSGLNQ
jgi:hypothetical protein